MSETGIGKILNDLRNKWGNYDSEILFTKEFKEMSPEEREVHIEKIADLYLQEGLIEERFMLQAQREAYTEGNSILYDGGAL